MPELPEVEVSRLGIAPHVVGERVVEVRVHQRQMRWPVPVEVAQMEGQHVSAVERRAKYLLLHTAQGSLVLHLGMSGSLRVVPLDTPRQKHDHVEVIFDHYKVLRLNDPRRFGAVLWQAPNESLALFDKLGPEPLESVFGGDYLYQRSRGRRNAVKNFIMDNSVVVGVGNIYATEALFAAGIDPRRAAGRISQDRYHVLASVIKDILAAAIVQGGTSLKDFTQADGKPGYFKQALKAYGRSGEPCIQCQTRLCSVLIGQRASVYCPACQR